MIVPALVGSPSREGSIDIGEGTCIAKIDLDEGALGCSKSMAGAVLFGSCLLEIAGASNPCFD